jgi:hypothetical protein
MMPSAARFINVNMAGWSFVAVPQTPRSSWCKRYVDMSKNEPDYEITRKPAEFVSGFLVGMRQMKIRSESQRLPCRENRAHGQVQAARIGVHWRDNIGRG